LGLAIASKCSAGWFPIDTHASQRLYAIKALALELGQEFRMILGFWNSNPHRSWPLGTRRDCEQANF